MAKHSDTTGQLNGSVVEADGEAPIAAEERADATPDDVVTADDDPDAEAANPKGSKRISRLSAATAAGVVAVVALGSLAGWLGYQRYENQQAEAERNQLVGAAKQGAVNLTSLDYTTVDENLKRIQDSATGSFRDDFQHQSQPFADAIKQSQSKSSGTVTAAGLQSQVGNQAEVLVAVTVKTTNAAAPEQQDRAWRMRITVKKDGDNVKIADVQFVP